MRRLTLGLIALVVGLVGGVAQANQDHFESRRRDAERRAELQRAQPELRPWGGPTTGTNWWTPQPRVQNHPHRNPTFRVIFVPGHYEWRYGRAIWIPPHYHTVPVYYGH